MRGLSLFASAGVGEAYLNELGFDIVVANERNSCAKQFFGESLALQSYNYPYSFLCVIFSTFVPTISFN